MERGTRGLEQQPTGGAVGVMRNLAIVFIACCALAAQMRAQNPGCDRDSVQQCLNRALEAMGGKERLQKIQAIRFESWGHTLLMEQSYRQEPFITSYERTTTTLDFTHGRMLAEVRLTWPESDENQSDITTTTVVGPEGGVRRFKDGDTPCPLSDIDDARYWLALGPVSGLLTAANARDLHFEKPEVVRSTRHSVLAFSWEGIPIRILLNPFNHLPDATDITREFHDFWFFWGDVKQRVYFENWRRVRGVEFPTNWVEERNGNLWRSRQLQKIEFNPSLSDDDFKVDVAVARRSAASAGWKRPFRPENAISLAPGIDFFPGPWNATIVKQSDGIVAIEAPISERYTRDLLVEAQKRYPGLRIKALLSTSDSWPHIGGVRFAVSQKLPVYILDLNRPLLDRLLQAPHSLDPDALEQSKRRVSVNWKIVSMKQVLGTGTNRLELYPIRGPSTERQYMVYFPEQELLYASDTLVINDNGTLYDPELMTEVAQAVKREGLAVNKVFPMHQGPTPWAEVLALIEKSQSS